MDDSPPRGAPVEDWPAAEPAAGFADRVMARLDEEVRLGSPPLPLPRSGPRRWPAALAGAAAALAIVAVVLAGLHLRGPTSSSTAASTGSHLGSSTRSTQQIGSRGVAVAEAGAALSWQVDADGNSAVSQQRGAVFYRVNHDTAHRFVVTTPQGQVRVTGTCFTIALVAETTEVQVHEGSVAVETAEDSAQLVAGERATLAGRHIARHADGPDPSSPQASLHPASHPASHPAPPTAAIGLPTSTAPADDKLAKINVDQATLLRWAETCHVRSDVPPFEERKPRTPAEWERYAGSMGATQAEAAAVQDAFAELEQDALTNLRELYAQTTGDKVGADSEPLERLIYEIARTSEFSEQFEVFQRMSAERAGLQPPPPREQMLPLEILLRELVAQGDYFEAALARRLGAQRARQLREHNQGWPGEAADWEGCPHGAHPTAPRAN